MIRKIFALRLLIVISFWLEIFLIGRLFIMEKNWSSLILAIIGFALLPFSFTIAVKSSKLQPSTQTVALIAIWSVWIVLAAIAGLAFYIYWLNNPRYNSVYGGALLQNGLD